MERRSDVLSIGLAPPKERKVFRRIIAHLEGQTMGNHIFLPLPLSDLR